MTLEELKSGLHAILALEEQSSPDWDRVQEACLGIIARLTTEPEPSYPHDVVYHYLDDPDIRRRDGKYGLGQRQKLKAWLGAG